MALLLMGEGEAFFKGERLPGAEAMQRAGIPVPGLQARDGLAAINGSNLLTAMSALHIYDMERWLKQAEIAAAMSIEALLGQPETLQYQAARAARLQGRDHLAQATSCKAVEGSDLTTGKMKTKVQDAYSMRSTPQVIGAARDAIAYARSQVEIELNGVGDNPIFVPELKLTLTGANFQGTPVALPMDMAGIGHHHGVRAVRAPPQPPDQPGPLAGAAGFPGARARLLFRPDAHPVHRRPPDRRAAHPLARPPASSPSPPPPTRRISSRWA